MVFFKDEILGNAKEIKYALYYEQRFEPSVTVSLFGILYQDAM